jgi:hypothetical protein
VTPITNLEDRALYAPLRLVSTEQAKRAEVSACTGNCNSGRMCDCVPAVADDRDEFTWREVGALLFKPAGFILAFVGLGVAAYFGWFK